MDGYAMAAFFGPQIEKFSLIQSRIFKPPFEEAIAAVTSFQKVFTNEPPIEKAVRLL